MDSKEKISKVVRTVTAAPCSRFFGGTSAEKVILTVYLLSGVALAVSVLIFI